MGKVSGQVNLTNKDGVCIHTDLLDVEGENVTFEEVAKELLYRLGEPDGRFKIEDGCTIHLFDLTNKNK